MATSTNDDKKFFLKVLEAYEKHYGGDMKIEDLPPMKLYGTHTISESIQELREIIDIEGPVIFVLQGRQAYMNDEGSEVFWFADELSEIYLYGDVLHHNADGAYVISYAVKKNEKKRVRVKRRDIIYHGEEVQSYVDIAENYKYYQDAQEVKEYD